MVNREINDIQAKLVSPTAMIVRDNIHMDKSFSSPLKKLYNMLPTTKKQPQNFWKAVQLTKKIAKSANINEISTEPDGRPYAHVNIQNTEFRGLLDSGASISGFGQNALANMKRLNLKTKTFKNVIRTANGDAQSITGYVDVDMKYAGKTKLIRLFIMPSLSQELYLGVDFWYKFGLLPLRNEELALNLMDDPNRHQLTVEQEKRLSQIIKKFPSSETEGLGRTTLLLHSIDTGDAQPVKQRHYPISPAVQKVVFTEIDRMISLGVIELSQSPWNSPVSVQRKSNGKTRLCLDARAVNQVTKKDAYPMPIIDGILSRLHETHIISSIDLKDAYWQVELSEGSREKTAFSVPGRPHYQFRRMPFGLCNSAQTMCRLMDLVIPSELRENVFVYLDDLLIVSADFDSHFERLGKVADCLRAANLTINVDKSKFLMRTIRYLGHIVGEGCIRADPNRISAIIDYPVPKTTRQIRSFLGMAGWYQRYVSNFSAIAAPITDLLGGHAKFKWTQEAQVAFDTLKQKLTNAPILTHPDFNRPFIIQCDASTTGVGSVLYQLDANGDERPIAFMSKKLNTAQRNYSITELECLAAVLSVKRFRGFVEGMDFKVITDHASLKWLMQQKDLSGRLARWSLKLQGFNFTIEHRKGSANIVPDALSRAFAEEIGMDAVLNIDMDSPHFSDQDYKELIDTVKASEDRLPDLKIQDGKIYKRVMFNTGPLSQDAICWKLWLPAALRQDLIQMAHEPPISSHGGAGKTLERLKRLFYWPNMSRDVRNMITQCVTCSETKAPNQTLRPPMGHQLNTERPFQFYYTDLLGPYPRSKRGNTHVLVVLDKFSKFVWLHPIRKASAKEIITFIENQVFLVFGTPEKIYSDNGVQFRSKEFSKLLKKYGVCHVTSATHAPQANASERVNRSVLAAVRSYVDSKQTTWDFYLSHIACSLRNSLHNSTGFTPYYSVFKQHMLQHGNNFKILRTLQGLSAGDLEVLPPADFVNVVNQDIEINLEKAHGRHEKAYNTRCRPVEFRIGQEVFRRNFAQSDFSKGFNAKLGKQWIRSRIRRKIGTCMYELEDPAGKILPMTYHAKDIKP